MIVDGKAIAREILDGLQAGVAVSRATPRLTVFTCAPNRATESYLGLKKKKAAAVGIAVEVVSLPESETTESITQKIKDAVPHTDSIIVQLPLPVHIDVDALVAAVPVTHDADALNPKTKDVLAPVVGACKEILDRHVVSVKGVHVTVLGNGRLVGQPVARWFIEMGAHVSIVTKDTAEISYYTQQADVIVCGAGDPGFLKPDMIKEGVAILDAGTSEEGGILRGDAEPACAEKAALFTPVPGGIGPLTIVALLRNVVTLATRPRDVL